LEYERAGRRQDGQNRSVRGVRAPGNTFEFSIDFHNLAPLELGALLWVLNFDEEGCFHRLGYAKPLGFGSVQITVDQIELLDCHQRYQSLDNASLWLATPAERSRWIECFEVTMRRCYGRPLRELPNIKDLIDLLSPPKDTQPARINYPRTDVRPDPEGKNFEWFVANKAKSTNPDNAGPNLPLEMPEEEKGLRLLEKIKKS
jgi:hypothetical protein